LQAPIDSLFFGFCLNICGHFDILRDSFDGDKKKFIKKHQELLELSETLHKLFKPIVFAQFLFSSMLLCVIGFQLVMVHDFFKRAVVAFYGLAIIIQLFYYSYGGQLLMDKSSAVSENLYKTDKDLVIVINRAHKACTIKAGFYRANSATFTTILSSAGSLIALLRSFIE
jgi:odorant receptor